MKYDIGIIGGGPAGYSAAFEAAEAGLSVVLFEKDRLGGTCLNRGCIPTKFLLHAAAEISSLKREDYLKAKLKAKGADALLDFLDSEALHRRQIEAVDSLRQDLESHLRKSKIEIVYGVAVIKGPGLISCEDQEYAVDNILIATGICQKKPGADGFITSDELLALREIPKTMKIVGGGTIAVEFAYIYSGLGTEVTIQIRGDCLLRDWSREVSRTVETILKQQGVSIVKKCSPETLWTSDAEVCLSAVGMEPEVEGLEASSFDFGEDGGIITNYRGGTKTTGIYAIGDVRSGSARLAHAAMEDGRKAVRAIICSSVSEKTKAYLPEADAAVTKCIYLSPEIAETGIDEDAAEANGLRAVSVKTPLYSNPMNVIYGGNRSFIRLTADAEKKTLIGARIVSERASDMISELSLAINAGISVHKLCENVRPHPSFAEGMTTAVLALKEALG